MFMKRLIRYCPQVEGKVIDFEIHYDFGQFAPKSVLTSLNGALHELGDSTFALHQGEGKWAHPSKTLIDRFEYFDNHQIILAHPCTFLLSAKSHAESPADTVEL